MTLFGSFLTPLPPCDIFQFQMTDFLGLNCFEILNELKSKYLLKPYLALCQKVFLPKALKTVFQKGVVTLCWTPPPLRVSRIIWMTPNNQQKIIDRTVSMTDTWKWRSTCPLCCKPWIRWSCHQGPWSPHACRSLRQQSLFIRIFSVCFNRFPWICSET